MKRTNLLLALIATLFFVTNQLNANNSANHSAVENILYHIFNFNFDKAKTQMNNAGLCPRDKAFLEIELSWWQAIDKDDKQELQDFRKKLKQIKKAYDTDVLYMDLITQTYSMRYHMAIKNYPAAIVNYFRIKELMRQEKPEIPKDDLSLHLYSLYSHLIELAEISYSFNPFDTGLEDQKKNHIRKISNHAKSDDFIRSTMGHYFLYKYYDKLAKDQQQADIHRELLNNRFPQNRFFRKQPEPINAVLSKNTY